jgi:hypothetical protein
MSHLREIFRESFPRLPNPAIALLLLPLAEDHKLVLAVTDTIFV